MSDVAKNGGGGELSQAEKEAIAAEFKAERAARLKAAKADDKVVPIESAKRAVPKIVEMSRAAREAYHTENVVAELAQSVGAKLEPKAEEKTDGAGPNFTFKDAEEEPKAEEPKEEPKADEEEALKAEPNVAGSDLNPEEQRERRLIRFVKLQQINSRYSVIKSYGGKCVVLTEGRYPLNLRKKVYIFQRQEAFQQWKANEFIPSLKKRNENDAVGPWWLRHPKRRQYDEVLFKPLALPVIVAPGGQRLFNTYLGWGVEPKQGDWSLIQRHIKEVLANGDPKTNDYILRWTAWGIQHPDELPLVALVLLGRKGRGKGTWARVLEKVYGNHSIQISNQQHLVGHFNAHLENVILLIADEAYWAGHKSDAGTLQRMITEPTLAVEPKGYDVRIVKNYIHLLMLAEHNWAVPAGQDERRYAVHAVSEEARGEAYFKPLYKEIAGGGPAAMLYDLQKMNLGDWHPRRIYRTAAFRRQQDMSLGHLEEWLLTLLEEGSLPSSPAGKPWASGPTDLLWDAKKKVPRCRDLSFNTLADFLREWGCDKSGGDARLWRFPSLTEMRAAWDQKYAPREWQYRRDWDAAPEPPLNEFLDEKL